MSKYDHKKIESKWQEVWEKTGIYHTDLNSGKPKHYNLVMFPYPSGEYLHMGHGYSYTGADVYARFKKLSGLNTFQPIGYDAFGLPAENFAIKNGVHPKESTEKNIEHAEKQLKSFGCMFDWSKKLNTSDPSYYKWTQWLFIQLYEQGLAYQKEAPVNWCLKCLTVLANEQVIDGLCERCDTEVVQKNMKQWFFKTTEYAERLINDFDKVDWPESSKIKQKNWIGRSEGVQFELNIKGSKEKIEVYTTRIDTVFGMTYVVLAPENPLVGNITAKEQEKAVKDYIIKTQKLSEVDRQLEDREKTGVFTGSYVVNPFNGEQVPIWISDYVIYGYGTGAVMAVPAHDERDFEFAKKFKLPVKEVVIPKLVDKKNPPKEGKKDSPRVAIQGIVVNPKTNKILALKWKKLPWTTFITGGVEEGEDLIEGAKREIHEETGYKNLKFIRTLGGPVETHFYAEHKDVNRIATFTALIFELENEERDEVAEEEKAIHDIDWITWEEMEKDPNLTCAEFPLWKERFFNPDKAFTDYGVLLDSEDFSGLTSEKAKKEMTEWLEKKNLGGKKINYRLRDWSIGRQRYWGAPIPVVYCDKCGVQTVAEKDLPVVLPEVKDFRPKGTGKGPLATASEFVNITCPKCGGKAERETDTMDTFVCSSFYFLRYPNVGNDKEMMDPEITENWFPVDMYVGGAEHVTMHLLYARFITKALYDAGLITFDEPFLKLKHQGMILGPDGKKMSKSRGNVVIPDRVISEKGADTFRLNALFMGPFEDGGPWNEKGIKGIERFLDKVWNACKTIKTVEFDITNPDVAVYLNKTIKKVGEDIENMKFNTAISALMTFMNNISNLEQAITKDDYENFLVILSPFAPHMTEEIWHELDNKESIFEAKWPSYDQNLLQEELVTVAVQINGKVRGEIVIASDATEESVKEEALKLENVQKHIEGKELKKVIYIKGKLLSIVI